MKFMFMYPTMDSADKYQYAILFSVQCCKLWIVKYSGLFKFYYSILL